MDLFCQYYWSVIVPEIEMYYVEFTSAADLEKWRQLLCGG